MKKLFFLTIIFILASGGISYGAKKILDNEGQITSNGRHKVYLPGKKGKVYSQGNYRDGRKEGRHETFDVATGRRIEICHYKVGQKHGLCKKFHPSTGELYKVVEFFIGVPHGEFRVYHPNGQLKSKVKYIYGDKQGKERIYFEDGKIAYEFEYKDGHKVSGKKYDRDGKVVATGKDISP